MSESEYLHLFQNLNVNRSGGKVAPHKAILLLSVIELIEDELITTTFIPLSETLINTFNKIWNRYISSSSSFSCKFNYPFFHLSSSSFWRLEKLSTYEEKKEYSMVALKRSFSGATISQELFDLLRNSDFRKEVKTVLIATYISTNTDNSNPFKSLISVTIGMLLIAESISVYIS